MSSLRNRCLTSPQLAASLNSTHKTPVSTSTVKRRLQDAGLLGRVPLSNVCVLLPIMIFYFYWHLRYGVFFETLPRRPTSRSHLFTVDFETGVLRCNLMKLPVEDLWGVFSQTRHSNVLFLLLSCAPGPPNPLSILVRQFALFCEGSSTPRCMRSSDSWQFLAWNNLNFSGQK